MRIVLQSCAAPWPPQVDALNHLAQTLGQPSAGSGRPIRFVTKIPAGAAYEQTVFDSGAVHTRPGNWHDFFNALVWLRFPLSKAALNARHRSGRESQPPWDGTSPPPRGPLRDAATLFDEDGVIVLSADPELADLLRRHEWKTLFWRRRGELRARMAFVVFGHALYDKLRKPFHGLCGKALFLEADEAFLTRPLDEQLPHIDRRLAQRWNDPECCTRPAQFAPLPLLGIPGVTPQNEDPGYYDDTRQFRPPRGAGGAGCDTARSDPA